MPGFRPGRAAQFWAQVTAPLQSSNGFHARGPAYGFAIGIYPIRITRCAPLPGMTLAAFNAPVCALQVPSAPTHVTFSDRSR